MNIDTLTDAMKSAERFLHLAHRAKRETRERNETVEFQSELVTGTKTTGALRRASYDLTRALAEMRKSS